MSQTSPEQATNLRDLFSPELQTSIPTGVDPADRARLITKVYTDFNIFSPDTAEQAPELITPQIEQLVSENPDQALEPFVAVNLTKNYWLSTLIFAFDQAQSKDNKTRVSDELWDQYDLANINRRTTGGEEPAPGDVRAQILTEPENDYQEAGLQATKKYLKEQIKFAKGKTLLNLTDYVLLQALRREEGAPLMDAPTFTRFVQLDKKSVGGDSFVGDADADGSRLEVGGSGELAYGRYGVRFSVGLEEA